MSEPLSHVWTVPKFKAPYAMHCKVCGIVRRADDKNKPCRGPVFLTLRDRAALDQGVGEP